MSCSSTASNNDVPDGDECAPIKISRLEEVGFSARDIQKLESSGYHTVESVAFSSKRLLMSIKGISEAKAERIMRGSNGLLLHKFTHPPVSPETRKPSFRISTGIAELDQTTKGGIESGCITEISEEVGCGKSFLCHKLCVTCQLGNKHAIALFIDTEGIFQAERILSIADKYGMGDEVLERIQYARAVNLDHLQQLLVLAAEMMAESQVRILIVNDVRVLRPQNLPRRELANYATVLSRVLRSLHRIAEEFDVAVVATHTLVPTADGLKGGPTIGNGGMRLELQKEKEGKHTCRVISNQGETEVSFVITESAPPLTDS